MKQPVKVSAIAVLLVVSPTAPAFADESTAVNSPSGRISCSVFTESITCVAPWDPSVSSGNNLLVYQVRDGKIEWRSDGQPVEGGILVYDSPETVKGWSVLAGEDGLTFKKDGKGVFVSVSGAHTLQHENG